jgi:hypothetical protein
MNLARYANWVTGISLGIGLFVVLNQLQIPYYLFYLRTTQTILISSTYDYYLFLASSICVPWTFALYRRLLSISVSLGTVAVWVISFVLAIINEPFAVTILYAIVICANVWRVFRSNARRYTLTEILSSALVIFALVEWSSICYWVIAGINPHDGVGMLSQRLEADLTFFLYPISIPMMLLLLSSWFWVPLIPHLSRPKAHMIVRYRPSIGKPDARMVVAALDLTAIIAIIIFFYPYLAGQTWVVGQDAYWRYVTPTSGLIGLSTSEAFNTSASHGVYVVLLYLIQSLTGVGVASIVKYAPIVLAFGSGSAVLFATLRGGWSFQLAILSSICTLLWLPTTIGIYVDVQANWLALLLWILFLGVYFASSEPSVATYVILAVLSFVILLVHPWTWGVFATTLLFTSIISRQSTWSKHCLRTLVATLVLALPLGITAYSLSPSLRSDLTNTIQLYVSGPINPASLLTFGDALANMFYNLGPVLSPALLLLCIVGAYALSRRRDITANYLIAWTAAWCIGSILVAPSGLNPTNPGLSETGLWRMLYISPLPFFLALGMEKCVSTFKRPIAPLSSIGISQRIISVLSVAPFLAVGSGLLVFRESNVRLLLVAAALVFALFLIVKLQNYGSLEVLIVSVLVLLLFNAAFRTLFPLVLDPHNIFSSAVAGPGSVPGR